MKDIFARDIEIIKACEKEILDLPYTPSFMKSFMRSRHMLFRHWKPLTDAVNGTVAMTLEKLPNICVDIIPSGKNGHAYNLQRVDKAELMSVKNPQYNKLLEKYNHLKGAKLEDRDTR